MVKFCGMPEDWVRQTITENKDTRCVQIVPTDDIKNPHRVGFRSLTISWWRCLMTDILETKENNLWSDQGLFTYIKLGQWSLIDPKKCIHSLQKCPRMRFFVVSFIYFQCYGRWIFPNAVRFWRQNSYIVSILVTWWSFGECDPWYIILSAEVAKKHE